MKNTVPLVSICSLTYNHEIFVRDCLDGFLMQETTFPVEIIVHDDASTDKTADIIREYGEKYPDLFTTILQEENKYSQGIKPIREFVYPKVRGKYIALCEGDDYWTDPLKIQKQVEYMEKNPGVVLTFHEFKNSVVESVELIDFYEPTDVPLLRPRTLTLMFRNLLNEYPPNLMNAANGDQALRFFLSTKGEIKPVCGIKPSVRTIHPGGVMSLQSKRTRIERGLQTWTTIYETYADTIYGKELKYKVRGFKSSLKWLDFANERKISQLKTALLYDIGKGILLRNFIKKLRKKLYNVYQYSFGKKE